MKTKHFLGLSLIGLAFFIMSMVMKFLHLQGADKVLLTSDIIIFVGLIGLGIKIWRNPNNPWLNH